MELMTLRTTSGKNRLAMDTSGLFISLYTDLAFIVENTYMDKLHAFLSENKVKLDLNYRYEDECTVLMRAVLGAQKIDLQKDSALDSIKKCEQCIKVLVDFGFAINAQDKYGHTAMHWAVMIQNPYVLRWLLKLGADPTIQDEEGQTILHLAIRISFADGITVIVENTPRDLLELPSRVSGATPLIYATQLGNRDLVKQLLDAGCNPNTQEGNKYQRAALHYAFFFDHDEIFELLLQRGADINVTDYKKKGMLQRAGAHTDGRYLQSIVENAQRATREFDDGSLKKVLSQRGVNGMTPLMAAAGAESSDNVELMCRMVKEQAMDFDDAHRCALHYCSKNRELRCVQVIYQAAAEMLETKDENGVTPLMQAVLDGNVDVARFLLQQGANILVKDRELHTVAHSATVSGSPEIVDLMSFYNADLSQPDIHHTYPLHYAVRLSTEAGTVEQRRDAHKIINKLIAKGVPVNCEDDDKRQPLFWAASAGDERTCTILNNAGADVNAANKDGLTALHCCASKGYGKLVEMLLTESNAVVDIEDKWGCTPLFYAITNQHLSCAQMLIKHGALVNHQDAKGRTAAHCACAVAFFDGVSLLKQNSADFTIQSHRSELPIHEATRNGHREMVAFLLDAGLSKANSKLRNGKTPLHQAVEQHDRDLVERLLAQGANVNSVMYEPPPKSAVIIVQPRSSELSSASSSRRDLRAGSKEKDKEKDGARQKDAHAQRGSSENADGEQPPVQHVIKLEEVGRTPLDIAIREGFKTIIDLLKQNGGAKAIRVITWSARVIQKFFRYHQEYKEMLRAEEKARVAAESEMRVLEQERTRREEEERRRLDKEYQLEVERRRAERALYEFSLTNVQPPHDDREEQMMTGVDGRIEMKVFEYQRKFATQIRRAQQARQREMDHLECRKDVQPKRKASFDGDKPPPSLPLPASSSISKQRRVESESPKNEMANSTTRIRDDIGTQNPPPGWFLKEPRTTPKVDTYQHSEKEKECGRLGAERAKKIRDSVARFDQTRRATAALQTLKRAQLRNISEDKIVERFTKQFGEPNQPFVNTGEKHVGIGSVSKSYSSGMGSSSRNTYSMSRSSTYDDRSTLRSGFTHSDASRSVYTRSSYRTASQHDDQPDGTQAHNTPKKPKEVRSLKEWEVFLKDQLRELNRSHKTAAKPRTFTAPTRTPLELQSRLNERPRPRPTVQYDDTMKQKRDLRKELKELVMDTKLLFRDTHQDADDFLEKVVQRNKEEEENIKQLLLKKRQEDLILARQQDDAKHGPRATVDTNLPQSRKLLEKRPTGPPKSVLKHAKPNRPDEKLQRSSSSIPALNRRTSLVSARSVRTARSNSFGSESSLELTEELRPKDANDKNWIRTFDGRYRKRNPLVLALPDSYLKMQSIYTDGTVTGKSGSVLAH